MARQTILLDNNAWDLLLARGVQLIDEEGGDLKFTISKLGEIEIPQADHPRADPRATGEYARDQMNNLQATPVDWLQLGDLNDPKAGSGGLGDLQPDGSVVGGGHLASNEGLAYVADDSKHKLLGGIFGTAVRPTGLLQNQTDIDYGQWAMDIPVVTRNIADYKYSKKIIDLGRWTSGSFGDFVRQELLSLT